MSDVPMDPPVIECGGLSKSFREGADAVDVLGGVTLALNIDVVVPAIERDFGIQFLAKDVYYISDLPSELLWSDVFAITGVSFVLTLVATLYPSWRASRLNPAEALRYE